MKIQEPKNNKEFERQILGALISDCGHQSSRELLDTVSPEDFYFGVHRQIFTIIKKMAENKKDVNIATIDHELSIIGTNEYLFIAELQRGFISQSALPGYISEIQSCRTIRDLQYLSQSINEMIRNNDTTDDIVSIIEERVKMATTSSSGRDLQHIKYATGDWLDLLERRENAGGGILGVKTGIEPLDEALSGFDEESLIVVAGLPSMGKTLFTQTLALNIGVDQKLDSIFFSMEMSANQLYERFITGLANISPDKIRKAKFNAEDNGRIARAVELIESGGIYFSDEAGLSVEQIRAKVRKHKTIRPDTKLIIVDYLGLMTLPSADRHDIAIGTVTRTLKELAKEVKIPIVLIAQANRASTKAKRPNMTNLKDSSCIEADADVIMFVHRHEILDPDTELKGITELIIAKDRHNDGNGTIYMEKINGGFRPLTDEQAAMIVHKEEQRLNPRNGKKSGWD